MSLVSVLIPCYNSERFVGETLESVFRQTWRDIEVVVVNDGSSDRSLAEVERFRRPNLIVLDRPNRGACASRNEAFEQSSGRFVQFLDADDLLSEDKIARQVERLDAAPDCAAWSEWARFRGDAGTARFEADPTSRDLAPVDWLVASIVEGHNVMFPGGWLVPRDVALKAGPWRPELTVGDDMEYFTRVALCSERVLFCEGARAYYRSGNAGTLSGRKLAVDWRSRHLATELCEHHVLRREDSARTREMFALLWHEFAHSAYPYWPALAETALGHARELSHTNVLPDGGKAFRAASRLIGWRLARRLQVATGRE